MQETKSTKIRRGVGRERWLVLNGFLLFFTQKTANELVAFVLARAFSYSWRDKDVDVGYIPANVTEARGESGLGRHTTPFICALQMSAVHACFYLPSPRHCLAPKQDWVRCTSSLGTGMGNKPVGVAIPPTPPPALHLLLTSQSSIPAQGIPPADACGLCLIPLSSAFAVLWRGKKSSCTPWAGWKLAGPGHDKHSI